MALRHTSEYDIWIWRTFLENTNILLDQISSLQNFNSKNSLKKEYKVHINTNNNGFNPSPEFNPLNLILH